MYCIYEVGKEEFLQINHISSIYLDRVRFMIKFEMPTLFKTWHAKISKFLRYILIYFFKTQLKIERNARNELQV